MATRRDKESTKGKLRTKGKSRTRKRFAPKRFVLNCNESTNCERDWTFEDALEAGAIATEEDQPPAIDLRETWWRIDNQGETGACVGYATAYGVLRWHYVRAGLLPQNQKPSARFIWMANKETDKSDRYPTTFIETAGTQTKLALDVARKYGCVADPVLPMTGRLATLSRAGFYAQAARLRIASYHNLGGSLNQWRQWLAFQGPLLTRLGVDRTWDRATDTVGHLAEYLPDTVRGGHAVCLVGYTPEHFIVRNSWGKRWGDKGFAYASNEYAQAAFGQEIYGAVL